MHNSDPPENITEAILPAGAELPPRPWRAQDSEHSFWEVVDSTGFVIRGLGCIYSKDLADSVVRWANAEDIQWRHLT